MALIVDARVRLVRPVCCFRDGWVGFMMCHRRCDGGDLRPCVCVGVLSGIRVRETVTVFDAVLKELTEKLNKYRRICFSTSMPRRPNSTLG